MEINQNTESFFYIKSAVRLMKRYWYLFVFSTFTCVAVAFFINWYLKPLYEVASVIIIENNNPNNKPVSSEEFMKSFSIFSANSNIQEEILKMKSTELINRALKRINAEIAYYRKDGIKTKEIFNDSPFKVEYDRKHFQPMDVQFYVIPQKGNKFQLVLEKNETPTKVQLYDFERKITNYVDPFSINQIANFGDTIKSELMCFRVVLEKEKDFKPGAKYFFDLNDLNDLTYHYQKMVEVEQVSKDIQASKISIRTEHPQHGIDFISALTNVYLEKNIEKKNATAESTIKYLDEQLGIIEDSLKLAEGDLQSFRTDNQVMNIASKADDTFKKAGELENQRSEVQSRIRYYKYISQNLESDQGAVTLVVPSSMGVNDNVLSGLIEEYIKLNTARNSLILNKQTESPYFNSLTIKIVNQKNTLSENIKNLISTNTEQLKYIDELLRSENSKISNLPGTERKLGGIERKYRLNDDNYNFMLRKKAEAQAAKASNIPNNDILEPAKLTQLSPVFPKKTINLAVGLTIGLFLPFAFFGIKNFFDNTVPNVQAIKSITNLPSIGEIFHNKNKKKQAIVLIDKPRSAISESIRLVRTNIEHALQGKRNQVIVITSTKQSEGKSFSSLNIAISLSLLNYKVVLVDFDIRKPNLYQALNVENRIGVSSYLEGRVTLEETIVSTSIPYLDFISSGPIPNNPSELANSQKSEMLIDKLREKYDYVIVDTPPIGLVTEAFVLLKYADLKIFVIREKGTPKEKLRAILKELEDKKVTDLYWLLNDVDIRDTFYNEKNGYYTKG